MIDLINEADCFGGEILQVSFAKHYFVFDVDYWHYLYVFWNVFKADCRLRYGDVSLQDDIEIADIEFGDVVVEQILFF